ncbi:hypothetical protein RHSIM_Rhsim10G0086300 [Rhododendron simsii]|uniref:Uncharacterized protein n=1 Tax=Rhododendron simsii TaxID=118357 RepID=A0A834GE07_RHOSS|nr:hypothetical protein RHSIM_Rhsim10G0086300 [Rhododendron simsii]
MSYKPSDYLVEEYCEIFPLGVVAEWNFSCQLGVWLDSIVYHSFVRYNQKVMAEITTGLRQYFPVDGASTWIVLRHGFKAWPVGGNHELAKAGILSLLVCLAALFPACFGIRITFALFYAIYLASSDPAMLGFRFFGLYQKMVVHVTFVCWAHVKNPALTSPIAAVYITCKLLEVRESFVPLHFVTNGIALRTGAFDTFLEDYGQILPLGGAIPWNFGCLLAAGCVMLYTICSLGSAKKVWVGFVILHVTINNIHCVLRFAAN